MGTEFSCSHDHDVHLFTITTGSSNGLSNARYCRYSDMSSWWWVEIPSETCRAVCRDKLYIVASCWIIIDTYYPMHGPLNIKYSQSFWRHWKTGFWGLYLNSRNRTWGPSKKLNNGDFGSVSSPLWVWELERLCSQTQLCQLRCLMTILDNYMFRTLLAIFRLSLRELKVLLYNVCARDGEISTSGLRNS